MSVLRPALLIGATITMGFAAGVFALYAHTVMPGLKSTDNHTFSAAFQSMDRAIINPSFNVPLNDAIKAAGDPDHIRDLASVRERFHETRWAAWNLVRVATTTAAFGCLAWALVLSAV